MPCWKRTNPLIALGAAAFALAAVLATTAFPARAWAAPGDEVTCFTTGTPITCTVIEESGSGSQGTVAVGDGTVAAVPLDAAGTVTVPATVKILDDWEQGRAFAVSRIAAHAFDLAGGTGALERISIAGAPDVDPDAFAGLPASVTFVVDDLAMAERLEQAGIALERVFYQEVAARYVAFGDSIAAGYALDGYDTSDARYDGQPTPDGAFPLLITDQLRDRFQTAQLDNEAMSGWTSGQLLDQLNRGDYNATLADADVVTVTIGSNDLLGRFIDIIQEAAVDAVNDARTEAGETGPAVNRFSDITEGRLESLHSKKPGIIGDIVNNINKAIENDQQLLDACDTFKTANQPAILARLHELAPHATVYWTTLYNPFYGTVLDLKELFPALKALYPREDLLVDLSGAGAHYIEIMNKAFENPTGYQAVDLYEPFNEKGLTNVDIRRDADGNLVFGIDPHPNDTGHALIGKLMNERIDATFATEQPSSGWASDLLAKPQDEPKDEGQDKAEDKRPNKPKDEARDEDPPASKGGDPLPPTGDAPLVPAALALGAAVLALTLASGHRAKR